MESVRSSRASRSSLTRPAVVVKRTRREAMQDAIVWVEEAARKMGLINWQFRSEVFKRQVRKHEAKALAKGIAKGRAEGQVEGKLRHARAAVLRVLKVRRVAVSPEQRRRVAHERDLGRLDRWLAAAVRARHAAEVFADA